LYSDGKYTPDEVCRRAKEAGVEVISITDHDTMNGLEDKRAAAKKHGLISIDGWEISAYLNDERVHVLGYGCKDGEGYRAFMQRRVDSAYARAKERVEKLNRIGIPLTMERVLAGQADKTAPIHTMHVARPLGELLGVSPGEAYIRYLEKGCPADSMIGRPSPKEAVECIRASGGVAFLAHPGRIRVSEEDKEEMIRGLVDCGLDGIECYYPAHTDLQTEHYLHLAKKYGLRVSGGSDTHWEDESQSYGDPPFFVDEELLSFLRGREVEK
jgi:predicted metal-dependent phosphoesterase TrpH